jgi:DNA-binding NarL/FixJ family response regulator
MAVVEIVVRAPVLERGLASVLEEYGYDVACRPPGEHDLVPSGADIQIVDSDAFQDPLLRDYVTAASASCAVLVVTSPRHSAEARKYLAAGASGVLDWNTKLDQLVSVVRQVNRGATAEEADPKSSRRVLDALSSREVDVLREIARGLTHGQVARRLAISPHTVDTYVKRIRSKLAVGNKAELTRMAVLAGLNRSAHI